MNARLASQPWVLADIGILLRALWDVARHRKGVKLRGA